MSRCFHLFPLLAALIVGLIPCTSSAAGKEDLLKDLVVVKEGKMTTTEFGLMKLGFDDATTLQVRLYAEAPASGVISRDNFVATTMILAQAFYETFEAAANASTGFTNAADESVSAFSFEEIDAPIGKVDLEYNVYMSAGGLQVETVNTRDGSVERQTMTWDELDE